MARAGADWQYSELNPHRAIQVLNLVSKDAQANMIAVGRLFGFDPSSRVHLAVPEAPAPEQDDDDGLDDIYVN